MADPAPLPFDAAMGRAAAAFRAQGLGADAAGDAALVLTLAEGMGIATHGLGRVETYCQRIRAGAIDPAARPGTRPLAGGLIAVDGCGAIGPAVAMAGLRAAIDTARSSGIAAAFCHRSTHFGAAAPYGWIAAEAGCAAIVMSSAAPSVAPPGGLAPRFGTNPLCFAVPGPQGRHFLFDTALSVAARSRIRKAAAEGRPIPEGWATDRAGRPTTDAAAALEGLLLPVAGVKGFGLALAVDLFAGLLSGAAFLSDIPDPERDPAAVQNLGQTIIVIDPAFLGPRGDHDARMARFAAILRDTPAADPESPVRMPGDRALAALARAQGGGLSLPDALLSRLATLAQGD